MAWSDAARAAAAATRKRRQTINKEHKFSRNLQKMGDQHGERYQDKYGKDQASFARNDPKFAANRKELAKRLRAARQGSPGQSQRFALTNAKRDARQAAYMTHLRNYVKKGGR